MRKTSISKVMEPLNCHCSSKKKSGLFVLFVVVVVVVLFSLQDFLNIKLKNVPTTIIIKNSLKMVKI